MPAVPRVLRTQGPGSLALGPSQPASQAASQPASHSQPASQPSQPASQAKNLPNPRSEVPICSAELSADLFAEFGAEFDAGLSAGKQIQQVFPLSQTCRIYVWKSTFTT